MNVADIFENYCAVILLLFSNGMVQIMLAFMYLFKKKLEDWTRLTTPSSLAHGFNHPTSDDIPNLLANMKTEVPKKMARAEENIEVLPNTNSVLEKQSE